MEPESVAEPVEESTSLADHEASYGPQAPPQPEPSAPVPDTPAEPPTTEERDDNGQFRPRHRAKSQRATPADAPRIAELTKRLRAVEEERDALKQRPVDVQRAAPVTPAATSEKFEFPTLEQWLEKHPEADWNRYQLDLLDARDTWRDQIAAKQRDTDQATTTQRNAQTAFAGRLETFRATHPDWLDVLQRVDDRGRVPDVLAQALILDDNGPAYMYHLAQHPDLLDEMLLLADGRAVTEQSVALLQRRLKARIQAASTGSVGSPPPTMTAPRPPNPVRTGPMRTGEELPDDASSLADHERSFSGTRRRR